MDSRLPRALLLFLFWAASLETGGAVSLQSGVAPSDTVPSYRSVTYDSSGYRTLIESSRSLIRSNPVQSLDVAMDALLVAEKLDSAAYISEANVIIGNRYIEFGEYDRSLEHFLRSYEIQEEIGTPVSRAVLTNNIAAALNQKGDFESAISYLEQSLRELPNDESPQTHAGILMNLGVSYHYLQEFEKAIDYFDRARQRFSDLDYQVGYYQALANVGEAEMELGRLEQALEKTEAGLGFFRERDIPLAITISLGSLANILYKMDRLDQALEAVEEAIHTAAGINALDQLKDLYELKSRILELQGRTDESLATYKLFKSYSDSVSNSARDRRMDFLQARLGLLSKERQIQQLTQQAGYQETLNWYYKVGILVSLVVTMLLIYIYYQKHQVTLRLEEQREKVREQHRELQSLYKQSNEFINIAAHDLKNSLMAIISVSDFLQNESLSEEEKMDYQEIVEQSALRMNNTLSNFLQVQSAVHRGSSEVTDVKELVLESVATYSAAAQRKSIELETDIQDHLPVTRINRQAAMNIIENLLSNAIKYSPPDSTIRIRLASGDSNVRFSVKDNGPGIPEKEQKDLYKKFKTLSTSNEDSTGLGLYIVKMLVEAAGGDIWCESRTGEGAVFYVELPT